MTSSPHGPYGWGYTRATMGETEGGYPVRVRNAVEIHPKFGLSSATRAHEVGIASNRGSACRGE